MAKTNLLFGNMKFLRCLVFLAVLLALAGCDTAGSTLENDCDFPILVVITYHDGRRADVSLRPGEKHTVASPAETIDEISVMSGGAVLYALKPKEGLMKLTPDGEVGASAK